MKIEKLKLPFPKYKTGEINSVVLVIMDETIFDEKTEKHIVTKEKTPQEAEEFLVALFGFCKSHGFLLDATGTREQMAARLFKKNGKDLITREEALAFSIDINNKMILHPKLIPSIKDVNDWVETLHDMK